VAWPGGRAADTVGRFREPQVVVPATGEPIHGDLAPDAFRISLDAPHGRPGRSLVAWLEDPDRSNPVQIVHRLSG